MNMTRFAIAAILGAFVCIPAQAALPSLKRPEVKITKPAITKGEDGTVTINKGDVKVEKPEVTVPELKKPTITKPEVEIEKPAIESDGENIKLKKPSIKVTKPGISL